MKRYIFIFTIISLIFVNVYSEDGINEQTEYMLNEIRNRNGIDYFSPVAEDEEASQDETEPKISEAAAINKNEEAKTEKPPKEPFLKNGRKAFAFGIEVSASASNSYLKLIDLFKESLEIDFNKMSQSLPKTGLSTSAMGMAKIYLDIYIKSKAEFGFFSSADAYGFVNIPKNIIDFAAKGNPSGKGFSGKITSSTFAFAETGLFYGMKFGGFKFRVSSSYFVPAFYAESDMGDYEFLNDDKSGKILARGKLNLRMYSQIPFFGNPSDKFDIKNILSKGGFDLSFYGSYTFNNLANLNFKILNIPIFPPELNKGIAKTYSGKFEIPSIVQYMDKFLFPGKAEEIKPPSGSFTETNLAYDLPTKKIFRPLKLAVSSDIRPFFNDYLIITPSIGCHCYKPFYVDAGVKLESRFLKVLGAYIGMSREDRVWKNTAGLFLETRVFRLETAVSAASPSFTGSFKGTGAEATLKLVFGY